jgi:hypothetical protein
MKILAQYGNLRELAALEINPGATEDIQRILLIRWDIGLEVEITTKQKSSPPIWLGMHSGSELFFYSGNLDDERIQKCFKILLPGDDLFRPYAHHEKDTWSFLLIPCETFTEEYLRSRDKP